ncbi:ankyrin repeat domain-containing protein [Deltaproteobacteria bacterium TL4]
MKLTHFIIKIIIISLLGLHLGLIGCSSPSSQLYNATLDNDLEKLKQVIETQPNESKKHLPRLLGVAAKTGKLEIVEYLIAQGVEVNQPSGNGRRVMTPLLWAAYEGHIEIVQALMNYGADLGALDYRGRTAMELAAEKGHTSVVQLLETGTLPEVVVPVVSAPLSPSVAYLLNNRNIRRHTRYFAPGNDSDH